MDNSLKNKEKTRIMFVCHGNICRSPMAETILKYMVKKAGREKDFVIESSATSTEEIYRGTGNPVYPPAREELQKHGLSAGNKRAVQLQKSDYDKYDVFYAMDEYNIGNIKRIFGSDPASKVRLLLHDRNVADPWYTGDFSTCYNDILEGCKAIMDEL